MVKRLSSVVKIPDPNDCQSTERDLKVKLGDLVTRNVEK